MLHRSLVCLVTIFFVSLLAGTDAAAQHLYEPDSPSLSWLEMEEDSALSFSFANDGITDRGFFQRGLQSRLHHKQSKRSRGSSEITSITVGFLDDSFRFIDEDSTFYYRNESAMSTVMFSAPNTSVLFGYGVQSHDEERDRPALRTIYVAAEAGENLPLFEGVLYAPLDVYIPVRVNLGYRATTGRPDTPTEDISTLHLANAQLAGGVGGQFSFPSGLPIVGDNLVGFASVVRGLGGVGDLRNSLDGVRLARSLDLNLEFQLRQIFGGRAGLTIGYTYSTLSWTDQSLESVFDFLDVLVGASSGFQRNSVQSLFRVGVNF